MSDIRDQLTDLVSANRILAHEGVVDGYGHVSIRHPERPDRFFLSRSRSPELVELDDILEFDLDCNPIDQRGRAIYGERPIHGAIYQARPDVQSVVHNHAYEVVPFTVAPEVKLRAMIHTAGSIGADIPVWDIQDKFGDTNLLVLTMDQGHDLARTLGKATCGLMRGHGAVVTGESVKSSVLTAIYLMVNARLQSEAMRFGKVKYLTPGEVAKTGELSTTPLALDRVWEYWTRRCGMAK